LAQNSEEAIEKMTVCNFQSVKALYGSESNHHPAIQQRKIFTRSPQNKPVKGFPFAFEHSPMKVFVDAPTGGQHSTKYLPQE